MKRAVYASQYYRQLSLLFVFVLFYIIPGSIFAQDSSFQKCATMEVLERKFVQDPSLRIRIQDMNEALQRSVSQRVALRTEAVSVTVPVVFHIVLTNPNAVTDAQIQAQLDTLNKDFGGINGDSVKIPSYFKPLFGKSGIRFCLAQRSPAGEGTTGIVRKTTTVSSFSASNSNIKHAANGGDDAWNSSKYLNIWIGNLSNGTLGFATLPGDNVPDEQGVVIQYTSVPGGSLTAYNKGKTLPHEVGHYFNLYHIWGDDNGRCNGTDFVDDTPNQTNSTSGCPGGVKVDSCSPASPGVMYQNFMDYTDDDCMAMFTVQQVLRMEAALQTYRSSLFTSDGCQPLVSLSRDAELRVITAPDQRLCTAALTPAVTFRNLGAQTLTSLTLTVLIDNVVATTMAWTGSIVSLASASATFAQVPTTTGNHILTIVASNPNGQADDNRSNDTLRFAFIYYPPFTPPITESFEGANFPPAGWDIVNPDQSVTWEKVSGNAKTGNSAVRIRNFDYASPGQKDYLRLPEANISGVDSAFFTFQVAAASYAATTTTAPWDTLEVLLSSDCGKNYITLYKKWGAELVTHQGALQRSYEPAASEWRKDSINITPYIANGNVMIAFRNTTQQQNNIYIDDINLYTVTVNPNLKSKGYLVTPNPTTGNFRLQFYPQPTNLRGIAIYSMTGQKITEIKISDGQYNNTYSFDLGRYAAGVYIVHAIFADRVVTQKVLKVQ